MIVIPKDVYSLFRNEAQLSLSQVFVTVTKSFFGVKFASCNLLVRFTFSTDVGKMSSFRKF